MPPPTIGSTVLYTLTAGDAREIEDGRLAAVAAGLGAAVRAIGNEAREGQIFPAVVVQTFGGLGALGGPTANLRVALDGYDTLWATSRSEGDGPGQWRRRAGEPATLEVLTDNEGLTPGVADLVHYVSYGTPGGEYTSQCRAAVVTEVTTAEVNEADPAGDGTLRRSLGLAVLNPTGAFFNRGVVQDEGGHGGGTWHWPCHSTAAAAPLPGESMG